jgi:hypothetical protein
MPNTFTFEEAVSENSTFTFEEAAAEESSGLPAGISDRQRKRLELASELAAERGRAETQEKRNRFLENYIYPGAEGALDALSFQPSRIARNLEGGIEAAVTIAQGKTEDGQLKPGETPYQLPYHPSADLSRPVIPIPTVTTKPDASKAKQIGAGAVNAVVDLANFIQSPDGVAMFGLAGLPKAVQQTVATSMAGTMAGHLPEQFEAAHQALEKGDLNEATRQVLGGAGGAVFASVLARHGVEMPRVPKSPEFPATVDPDLAARNLAAPGTVRASEQRAFSEPKADAPNEFFSAGEVPFERMRRFGGMELPPVEIIEPKPAAPETRAKAERETRGKVSFGAEAPTLLRTAMEERTPQRSVPTRKTFSFEEVQHPEKAIDEARPAEERAPSAVPETITGPDARTGAAMPAEGSLETAPRGAAASISEPTAPAPIETIGEITANARRSIQSLPPERRELVENFMHDNPRTKGSAGFVTLQKELDALDALARSGEITREEWGKHIFFQPPNTLLRWGHPEERPLTRQEAQILNDHKPQVDTTNKLRDQKKDWPRVKAGDLPTQDQVESLTGQFEEGRRPGMGLWGERRMQQYDTLRKGELEQPGLVSGTSAEKWADATIQESSKRLHTGLDPQLFAAYVVKGAAHIERGVRDFAKWSAAMVKEFGETIRPHLQRIFDEAQSSMAKIRSDASGDTGGRTQRKLAARGMESPDVATAHQERLGTDLGAFYEPQRMTRIEDAIERMNDAELGGVPMMQPDGPNNVWVAAQLELYRRNVASGNLDAAWSVMENAMRAGTSLGQLVNQFKLLRGATPDGVILAFNRRLISAGADPLRPSEMLRMRVLAEKSIEANARMRQAEQNFAREASDANFEAARDARMEAIERDVQLQEKVRAYDPKSFWDVLSTILQGNLLAPISLVANVTGNMNNLLLRGSSRSLATVVDAIDARLRGRQRAQTIAPLRAGRESAAAVARSVPEAIKTLYRGASDLELSKADARTGLRPLVALRNLMAREAAEMPKRGGKVPPAELMATLLEASPFSMSASAALRSLAATDLPFRKAARARLITEAMKLRTLRGQPKATPKEIRQAVEYPELFFDKAEVERIDRESLKATYQDKNAAAQFVLGRVNQASPFARFLFRTVAPYVTTPVNVVAEILSFVPGISTANVVRHARAGRTREAQVAAGKMVLGGIVTGAGVWLYQKGLLSPSLEDSEEAQKGRMLSHQVIPPNHLNLSGLDRALKGEDPTWREGDRTVNVLRGGGVAGALMLNAANTLRRLETQPSDAAGTALEVMRDGVMNTMGYAVQQSYTRGIADALDAARGEKLDQFFMNYADGLGAIVLPNTLKSISRATREYQPEVRGDRSDHTLNNLIRNKLGFTGAASKLPYKRDLWGRPVLETPEGNLPWLYQTLDISKARTVPTDPLAIELYTLWRRTGDDAVIPTPPAQRYTMAGKTYQLTREQLSRLQQLVGGERRQLGERIVGADAFATAKTDVRLRRLRYAWDLGAERGRMKFWQERRGELEEQGKPRGFVPAQ